MSDMLQLVVKLWTFKFRRIADSYSTYDELNVRKLDDKLKHVGHLLDAFC
jgi:hypothetical protein